MHVRLGIDWLSRGSAHAYTNRVDVEASRKIRFKDPLYISWQEMVTWQEGRVNVQCV